VGPYTKFNRNTQPSLHFHRNGSPTHRQEYRMLNPSASTAGKEK
jgi:hypothetical protein